MAEFINPDDLITLPEAARILGVSEERMRIWINEGRLIPARKKKPVLFDPEHLVRPSPKPMEERKRPISYNRKPKAG